MVKRVARRKLEKMAVSPILPSGLLVVSQAGSQGMLDEILPQLQINPQLAVMTSPAHYELLNDLDPAIDLLLFVGDSELLYDICRIAKRNEACPPIVFVLDALPQFEWTGYAVGADDFVVRPATQGELWARLTQAVQRHRQQMGLMQSNSRLEQELADRNRALERALVQARELAILKDNIVANVSHELRTPMVHLKGAISLLAEDIKPSKEGHGKLIHYALTATGKLEGIIQNITQLASALNLRIEPFSLNQAIDTAMRQLKRTWESRGGVERVLIKVDPDLPFLCGDRAAVAQVLQQLIDNAIKFSPDGTHIEVTSQLVGSRVRITIRDSGIGIPEDQLEKIFQAFYQINSGSTRPFGGVGNGLAIVKLILDALGSSVHVDSRLRQGSSFSFTLVIATSGDC